MRIAVDASIAVKWFVTEQWTDESRRLLARNVERCAPDLILSETANVIWKKARRQEIQTPHRYFAELGRLPAILLLRRCQDLIVRASAIALQIDHPVYDCIYLAYAEDEGIPLVTADKQLKAAADGHLSVDVWNIGDEDVNRRIRAATSDVGNA